MFEHSLYETERVVTPLQEGDLFYEYEIKNWEMTPRIYRILAIAAAANLLAILIIGQTSLLTMKGCDSPLVGRVCQVLDTIYVGSKLLGTDREYVDAVYEKTELGDSDITFVDVSGETPPLSYPEGYFQLANPEEFAMQQQMALQPGFDSSIQNFPSDLTITRPTPGNSLLDTQPIMPTPNPSVVQGSLPTFNEGSIAGNRRNNRRNRPVVTAPDEDDSASTEPKGTPTPAPPPLTSESVTAVEINKKPLTDFADEVVAKWDSKEVDLNKPFTIVLDGVLTQDGKLDRDRSKFDVSKQAGDPKMIDVAKAAMEAVGDSGFLTYLKNLDVDKVTVTLVQDDEKITALISSLQKTPEKAKTVASGLSFAIMVGKSTVKNPSDERTLLDGAKVTSDGKSFVLNFVLPKPVAQEMITRKLKEAQAKKTQQGQPSGDLEKKSNDNAAVR